jgi:hypothetical protein
VKGAGWLGVVAGAVAAGLFAFLNRFERVSVNLGLTRIDALPLSIFFFAAFLLGMAVLLLLSLPHDRRTRDLLRAHGLVDESSAVTPPRPDDAPPPAPSTYASPPADPVES